MNPPDITSVCRVVVLSTLTTVGSFVSVAPLFICSSINGRGRLCLSGPAISVVSQLGKPRHSKLQSLHGQLGLELWQQ